MTSPSVGPVDAARLAQRVADAVAAEPAVARLDGGEFGAVATHLPGRRLVGVRIGRGDEPVEIAVVLGLARPIPAVVRALRARVAEVCAAAGHPVAAVDVTVADVDVPDDPAGPATDDPAGPATDDPPGPATDGTAGR